MEHCHSFKSIECSMVKPGVMVKIEEEELYDPQCDGCSETSTGYPAMKPEIVIKEERNEENAYTRSEEMYEDEESPGSSAGHYVKNVVVKLEADNGAYGMADPQCEERISSPEQSPENLIQKRWRSARDQFRREMVHYEGLSGLGPLNKKPYMYLQQLMFLKPVLDLRPAGTKTGAETDGKVQPAESEAEVTAARPVVVASESCVETPANTSATPTHQQAPPIRLPGRKSKKTAPSLNTAESIDSQVLDFVKRNIEEDPEDAFCRSLGHYIRQVPPGWRLRLRTAIQTLIEGFTPPNNPEQLLGLLSQVKLARPTGRTQPMNVESSASAKPISSYQLPTQPNYGPSTSNKTNSTASSNYPQSSSHSSQRHHLPQSRHSSGYGHKANAQASYPFQAHHEPSPHISLNSGVPYTSVSSPSSHSPSNSHLLPISTSCSNSYYGPSHLTHPPYTDSCSPDSHQSSPMTISSSPSSPPRFLDLN
ncbi:uncharacterized protein [Engystomops pustulosus]|uniref:uncharacterized protein isoform X3 n=1 Tax=Engystomops pustulosus TaxID=76066 RepID=UPI003AFACC76